MGEKGERYDNLDGFRTISCLCIIAYHIKKYSSFQIGGPVAKFIDSWTQFVPLFLMISGFGIFCGYYERMKSQSLDIVSFYKKRYAKILPFFTFMLLIDLIVEFSGAHMIEALTEATMVFGLLPNYAMDVCAVGWTLGVIFVFYMLFPFIVFLCSSKKKTLGTLAASIVISLFCSGYFITEKFVVSGYNPRRTFLYCAPYFIAGGGIYLYRHEIKRWVYSHRILSLLVCVVLSAAWFLVPVEVIGLSITMLKNLIVFSAWLCYAVSVESVILNNKVFNHLSKISLELYLAQMVIFRGVEKLFGLYFAGDGWLAYFIFCVVVIAFLIVFVETWKCVERFVRNRRPEKLTEKG